MPQNYPNRKLSITILTKAKLLAFQKTVPPTEFGPAASYTTATPKPQPTSTPPLPHADWNGVMRGVDPEISDDDLTAELKSAGINVNKVSRITSKEGHRTYMVRVFFITRDDAEEAINNGVNLLVRRYRIEPPLHKFRHIPCRNCCQYGHTHLNCQAHPKCHRCGKPPTACTHPRNSNEIMRCSTCDQRGHYTGQIKCPKYHKVTAPPPEHQYFPVLPNPPTHPSPKPIENVWNRIQENNTKAKQDKVPEEIVNLITSNIKIVTDTLTTYIEKKLQRGKRTTNAIYNGSAVQHHRC